MGMSDALTNAARWLFCGTFIFAPWAYGCTRPWTINVLNALLAASFLMRVLALIVDRERPTLPWGVVAAVGALLAQGWFMALNAHGDYDPEFHQFVPLPSWWEQGPGAIDRAASLRMMARISALLGALLFTIDLAREGHWRRRLCRTIFLAGASIVAFGLVERILGAPMIFWEEGREAATFFATYVYHGNAGSFINLVLPVAAVLTVHSFRRRGQAWQRAIYLPALLVIIAGAFVNVSKAAMLISLLLLIGLIIWQGPVIADTGRDGGYLRLLGGAVPLALAVGVLLLAGGWHKAAQRWMQLPHILREDSRAKAAGVAGGMIRDSGWLGFGPGTFESAFPHYSNPTGESIQGIWRYAHEDYLQTVVEWGWVGAAGWFLLIFGGLAFAIYSYRSGREAIDGLTRDLHLAVALSLSATALHSLVDFPFQIASLQLYTIAGVGIGWSSILTQRELSSPHRHRRSRSDRRNSSSNRPRSSSADD